MNLARIACPILISSGSCTDSNCPYNHANQAGTPVFSGSAVANQRAVEGLTGGSGQYVGSRKGANAVPVKQTGDLPAFLKNRVNKLNAPPDPPARSGGNQRKVSVNGGISHIPASRAIEREAPMDWKSAVISQANWTTLERRKEELRKLISSRNEGRRVLRSLEEEIGEMQSKINSSDNSESFRKLCREISVRIADTQDRLKGSLSLVEEERRRVMETLNVVGESGLVDTLSLVKEQERIFNQVSRLLEATVRNMEFIGTEFRASASSRLGTRGN